MKIKTFFIVIMAGFLLTGCTKNASDNHTSEPSSQTETEVADDMSETSSQTEADTAEDSSETGNSGQDTYVLSFEANTIDGEELTSECFAQSKLTMINVWATYCNPCLSEMPDLAAIADSRDASEFQMIGIISDVMEGDEEGSATAKDLIAQTGADYPHLLLNESLYSNLLGGVDSVPTTFFVNQKGEVLGYVVGANSKENWEGMIDELLAETE